MSNVIHLDTKNSSYIMDVLPTGELQNLYYGKKIRTMEDYYPLQPKNHVPYGEMIYNSKDHPNIGLDDQCLEYSGLGKGDFREPAIELTYADGSITTHFTYKCHKSYKSRISIPGLPSALGGENDCETTEIELCDCEKDMLLSLYYCVYKDYDVITRFAVLKNNSGSRVDIRRMMSAQLDLFDSNYSFTTFDGSWACERFRNDHELKPGIFVNDSKTGNSSNRHNPFVMLVKDGCDEQQGQCYAINLVYSGCHSEICEVTYQGKTRLLTGINPSSFNWVLENGESFRTPEAVLTYSSTGLNSLSQNLHEFIRKFIVRGYWQDRERPILINNWEATEFDFNQIKLLNLAKEAASLGIELFVLDDGWFGRRDNDICSLGDWYVNEKKLPEGISGLASKVNKLGMMFGLWVEPEMVNEDSDLYRAHPDWIICTPGRKPSYGRNQFVLDLTKPEVRRYITDSMIRVFSLANIQYIKWDMNRNMSDMYSSSLPPEKQGEFLHRYMLGLYEILQELTMRFPEILFESCASGGNRFDLGMLCYMPQAWTSDNTDAYTRLAIQSGTSYGYPLSTMGAHVSASPNMQTLRTTPIETRFNVAAFGLLGYELDLTTLFHFDKKAIEEQVKFYKQYRRILQFGRFYRLSEPLDKDKIIWLCVSGDRNTAISGIYQGSAKVGLGYDILKLDGLEDDKNYNVTGRKQYINVKAFGNLVNRVLPIKIRGDGVIHTVLSSHYMFGMTDEKYQAGGDLLNSCGIKLLQQFSGTGYNENIRILSDYGSRLYTIEETTPQNPSEIDKT
jgi:Alpha-galactosidase